MTEQRRPGQDRKSINLLVKLAHNGVEEFVEKYATNLSPGGMFIRSREPKPLGTRLNFRVEIAQGTRVMQGSGVVKWVRELNDPSGPPGMGIEFTQLDKASEALVVRMLTPPKAAKAPRPPPPPKVAAVKPDLDSFFAELPAAAPPPPPPIPPAQAPLQLVQPVVKLVNAVVPLVNPVLPLVNVVAPPPEPAPLEVDIDIEAAPPPFNVSQDFELDIPPAPPTEIDIDLDTLVQQTPEPPLEIDLDIEPAPGPSAIDFEVDLSELPRRVRDEPKSAFPPLTATPTPAPAEPALPPFEFEQELPEIRRVTERPPEPTRAPERLTEAVSPAARVRGVPGKPIFLTPPDTIDETGPVIGIDLGTTNSCCAVLNNGKPHILQSKDGYNTIPSVVALGKQGNLLVGHRARSQMLLNPSQSISGAKRLVGRDFDSQTVADVRERFHYEIIAGPDGKAAVALGNNVLSLEEVQGIVLRECKNMAEQHLGQKVNRAVITCPAYYSEQQREAVRKAAAMAGLKVERVLNEPTAAALAYGLNRELSRRVLVYDLGGGTFDATLMRIDKNVFEVLATGGDVFLGGLDFDNQVVDVLLTKFQEQNAVPFAGDAVALSRVTDQAERAKIALSERASFDVHLPMLQMTPGGQMLDLKCTLTRDELNAACTALVDRTIDVVRDVLLDAAIKAGDVDDVILVGGMSRMPLVREKIKTVFKKPPQASVNADEAVALGAALYSGTVDKVSSVVLIDVVPMTIGLGLPGGGFKRIIERNTPLPAAKSFSLATSKDNEDSMELQVFQGEDSNIGANEYLGTLRIEGLPKLPKGAVQLAVTLKLDSECVLLVDARELRSRRVFTSTLATRYTPQEIRSRLGITTKAPSEANTQRAAELKSRAGKFWGFLKRVVGRA